MDQESFRLLLSTTGASSSKAAKASSSSSHVRGSLLAAAGGGKKEKEQKQKAGGAGGDAPAFKPRTLKKGAHGEAYRDRAEERRLGLKGDYAQVRACLGRRSRCVYARAGTA